MRTLSNASVIGSRLSELDFIRRECRTQIDLSYGCQFDRPSTIFKKSIIGILLRLCSLILIFVCAYQVQNTGVTLS